MCQARQARHRWPKWRARRTVVRNGSGFQHICTTSPGTSTRQSAGGAGRCSGRLRAKNGIMPSVPSFDCSIQSTLSQGLSSSPLSRFCFMKSIQKQWTSGAKLSKCMSSVATGSESPSQRQRQSGSKWSPEIFEIYFIPLQIRGTASWTKGSASEALGRSMTGRMITSQQCLHFTVE